MVSNFIVLNSPINLNHYSVECEVMWISGGFFEDGPTVGYQIWEEPASDGLFIDDYLQSVLSSYSVDKAVLYRNDREGDEYSGSSVSNENLGFDILTDIWYNFKIEVLLLSGTDYNVKLFINETMYLDEEFTLDGNQIALGGWKGQYGQEVYYDNFYIINLEN